jgi:hypothetical protein
MFICDNTYLNRIKYGISEREKMLFFQFKNRIFEGEVFIVFTNYYSNRIGIPEQKRKNFSLKKEID